MGGGGNFAASNSVFTFDGTTWSNDVNMNHPVAAPGAASNDSAFTHAASDRKAFTQRCAEALFVVGGLNDSPLVQSFNGTSWTDMPPFPTPRQAAGVSMFQGGIVEDGRQWSDSQCARLGYPGSLFVIVRSASLLGDPPFS